MNEKKKSKGWKIFLIILGVLILILAGVYLYITKSSTTVAFLNVEAGEVLVDQGKGYIIAEDKMKLGLDDKIKTGSDGQASLILYESAIISINPDSEIIINDLDKENLNIEQTQGSTWNKFTGLLGIATLTIETPETVATVRGTSFEVTMDSIIVGEGLVEVNFDGNKSDVEGGKGGKIENGIFVINDLTPEEKQRLANAVERHIKVLKTIRLRELEKKKTIVDNLVEKQGITKEEFMLGLDEADEGNVDLDEVEKAIPIKIDTISKVRGITEKIIEEKKLVETLRSS